VDEANQKEARSALHSGKNEILRRLIHMSIPLALVYYAIPADMWGYLERENGLLIIFICTLIFEAVRIWKKQWSTYTGGANLYPGSDTTDTTAIQRLANNAEINSEALIVRGSILLPAYEVDAGENVCSIGKGYFYLFRLDNGLFPDKKFIVDDIALAEPDKDGEENPKIEVGEGRIHNPRFTIFNGLMTVYGHTEDSSYKPIKLLRPVLGARTWREIRQD
jgi:hypothetical protein